MHPRRNEVATVALERQGPFAARNTPLIHDSFPDPTDIGIPKDTLAFIVLKARAYDAEVDAVDPDDGSNAADDRGVDVLESGPDNPTGRELQGAIAGVNDDARRALVALAWLGRGDFGADEWSEALAAAAAAAHDGPTSRYLMGLPLLGDLLEEGADMLGVSLTREEQTGMHNPVTEEPSENDRD